MESTHKSALLTRRQWRKDGESFKIQREKNNAFSSWYKLW